MKNKIFKRNPQKSLTSSYKFSRACCTIRKPAFSEQLDGQAFFLFWKVSKHLALMIQVCSFEIPRYTMKRCEIEVDWAEKLDLSTFWSCVQSWIKECRCPIYEFFFLSFCLKLVAVERKQTHRPGETKWRKKICALDEYNLH